MPSNKYALLRYRVIDRSINHPTRPYPTKEDLRVACEEALYGSSGERISLSTIEKDLWSMRNEGDLGYYAPILYSATHRGYHYEDPNYSINDVNLSTSDLQSLRFAAMTLVQFQDAPVFRQYQEAIGKIFDRVSFVDGAASGASSKNPSDGSPGGVGQFVQFEQAPKTLGTRFFDPLLEALEHKLQVQLSYRKFSSDQAAWLPDNELPLRTVSPYLLKEYRNRWYLIAHELPQTNEELAQKTSGGAKQVGKKGVGAIKTFAFDRIAELTLTASHFERDPSFNSSRYFSHSIGITAGLEAATTVAWEAAPLLAHYLDTQPLHLSQRALGPGTSSASAPGWKRYEMEVHLTYELQQIFLGFGAEVRVLAPAPLVQQICTAIESARSHYS